MYVEVLDVTDSVYLSAESLAWKGGMKLAANPALRYRINYSAMFKVRVSYGCSNTVIREDVDFNKIVYVRFALPARSEGTGPNFQFVSRPHLCFASFIPTKHLRVIK